MLFYVGTYSTRGSNGIYTYKLDPGTGSLTLVGSVSGGLRNISYLALHPTGRYLYSTSEIGNGAVHAGAVASFALNAASGLPEPLNQQPSMGNGACHVEVDRGGKNLLVANYGSGSVAILPIGNDGSLAAATTAIQDQGPSGVNAHGRQTAPHAHSIYADHADRYAISADLGCDKLFVYRLDTARGGLIPNSPPATATKPGAGPRHIAIHPTEDLVFAINELDSTMTAYRYDPARGTLAEVQSVSTVPDGFTGTNYPAEVRLHPNGRFLYGSNRGHDSIVGYAIDLRSGSPHTIGIFPTLGKAPRNFGIDPTGAFLVAANQESDALVVFRIDQATGRLTPTGVTAEVPSPVCVTFARR